MVLMISSTMRYSNVLTINSGLCGWVSSGTCCSCRDGMTEISIWKKLYVTDKQKIQPTTLVAFRIFQNSFCIFTWNISTSKTNKEHKTSLLFKSRETLPSSTSSPGSCKADADAEALPVPVPLSLSLFWVLSPCNSLEGNHYIIS